MKLYQNVMPLLIIITLQMPICNVYKLLYDT